MDTEQPFRLLMFAGSLVIFPVMAYHRLKARTGEPLDRRQEGLLGLLVLRPAGLCTMAGVFTYLANPSAMAWAAAPFPIWMRWVGIGLGLAAAALLFWTVHTLGPNLTDTVVTRRIHALVTAGPYRWVRHPFYASVALLMAANALAAANWFIVAGGIITLSMLFVRTGPEEARLVARFGDSYRDYMARTGRLLPRLGRTPSRLNHSRA